MTSTVLPAYQGELMLAGWSATHSGGAKVTFWLPDDTALEAFKHLTVRKGNTAGQRFMAVLVQIGDNDEPITPGSDTQRPQHALSRSAALICKSDDFQQFVKSKTGYLPTDPQKRDELAAQYVRDFCRVESRSDIDKSPTAQQLFQQLMADYRAWLAPSFT